MKKIPSLSIILSLCLGLFVSVSAEAASKKSGSKAPTKNETVITSVNSSSITVKTKGGTGFYKIVSDGLKKTEVTIGGASASISNLKPGMKVIITQGMDQGTADRIDVK